MSNLFNLIKKELKELITIQSMAAMFVVLMIFVGMGAMINTQTEEIMSPAKFGVVNLDDETSPYYALVNETINGIPPYGDMSDEERSNYVVFMDPESFSESDSETLFDAMHEVGVSSVLVIDRNFSADIGSGNPGKIDAYYISQYSGAFAGISSEIMSAYVSVINEAVSNKLIAEGGIPDGTFLKHPVYFYQNSSHTYIEGSLYDGITPAEINGAIMSQTLMIPVVIMIIITMVGGIVISSMGNEKENKTLETLLTLPVRRTTVVASKVLSAGIMGMIYGVVYISGMYVYMQSMFKGAGGINLADYGMSLDAAGWIMISLLMFASILCALGMCMILGAFVKNFKSAQTMALPVTMLTIIPMMVFMFSDWNSLSPVMKAILFAIPFSHPMMGMQNLMFGNNILVFAGLGYCTLFAIAMIMITVKIYNSDILLVGIGQTRIGRFFAKYKKKSEA
ncbi:MAG: ABC transporter permease [Candidatus Methanomethylophilaceae archaeon]|jgi:ABC-2 type transport system permease protein